MIARMSPDFVELYEQRQKNLINFLKTELNLGFTLTQIAQLNSPDHPHSIQARENAQRTLQTVRKFEGSIADPEIWRTIHRRADELDKAISTL